MAEIRITESDSIAAIPDDISYLYLPNASKLSQRALQKGVNYFTQGYIHNIKTRRTTETSVTVDARCWRSMKKSQDPHKLHIEIKDSAIITESFCSCMVGLDGHCSHIVGLLKSLQGFKLHNFTHVPDQQSCTSIPQQWHVPRGAKIKPVPINHVIVSKPAESRKRKPILCQLDQNYRLPKITQTDIDHLTSLKGTPLSYILTTDAPMTTTEFGEVQSGSILSYQTRNLKPNTRQPAVSQGCGDTCIHNTAPVPLPPEFHYLNVNIQQSDIERIELETRSQSKSRVWYEERKLRLTSSNFGKVLSRKAKPTDSFLSDVFNQKTISASPLEYGKRNEKHAKAKLLEEMPSCHIHECGLVINKEFTFLGASPDGKVCIDGECGLLEVKCPYSARNLTISEACTEVTNFCLEVEDNTHARLKKNHVYYAQVQGQLLITGCNFCLFVVFTQKEIHVERIVPDIIFMQSMLEKLAVFYRDYGLAFLNRN